MSNYKFNTIQLPTSMVFRGGTAGCAMAYLANSLKANLIA